MSRRSRCGSDKRKRQKDVRFRLDTHEVDLLDACARAAGHKGQRARGDWLRETIGAAPVHQAERAVHQRVPLSGGQALLAELGDAGVGLDRLVAVLERLADGILPADAAERIQADLVRITRETIGKVDAVIDDLADDLGRHAERVRS
jgi:hypothetical protein